MKYEIMFQHLKTFQLQCRQKDYMLQELTKTKTKMVMKKGTKESNWHIKCGEEISGEAGKNG